MMDPDMNILSVRVYIIERRPVDVSNLTEAPSCKICEIAPGHLDSIYNQFLTPKFGCDGMIRVAFHFIPYLVKCLFVSILRHPQKISDKNADQNYDSDDNDRSHLLFRVST